MLSGPLSPPPASATRSSFHLNPPTVMPSSSLRWLCGAAGVLALGLDGRADLFPEWVSTLPVGSSYSAGFQGMVTSAAGVSYVVGTEGSSSNSDLVAAAFGPDGTLLWSRSFNGPADWHDQGRGLRLGPGGVLWVTGNTPGPGTYANVLLLAFDAATGSLRESVQHSSGAYTSEHGASVVVDAQGRVFVGGGTVGDGSDGLIVAFDSSGGWLWTRTWDGAAWGPYSQDTVLQVELDPEGHPVVLIHGVMPDLQPDYVVLELDPADGTSLWEATWGTRGGEYPTDMVLDAAGNVYVTGTGIDFRDKYSTIKLQGSDGQLVWQAYDFAGLDNHATALTLDGQGGVYVTGAIDLDGDPYYAYDNDDFYTVKRRTSDGALLWTHSYGLLCQGCYDVPTDVVVDDSGHVFVAGTTSSPPYSSDVITFVLDAATGLEQQRGVIASGAGSGVLRFDADYDLYNGGQTYDANSGSKEISVFKYAALSGAPYSFAVANLVSGSFAELAIRNATPLGMQYVALSLSGPGAVPVGELGVTLGLASPLLLLSGPADSAGNFSVQVPVPPGARNISVWLQSAQQGAASQVWAGTVQ